MSPVEGVDHVFWYILGISFVLLIGITAAMIVFAVKYRRSKHPVPATFRDNWKLEIIWTIVPTIIALSMFAVGWKAYVGLRSVPEDALTVDVYAQQFSWIFVYPNDKETEDELVVPFGKSVKLNLTSEDVLHGFSLPAYRIKVDAVPGMQTYAWFEADKVGTYDIHCTEYCGVNHSKMAGTLRIVPEEEYLAWLEEE
ncbi:MAG: cytochrome c oxidase subunit II [Candidatus Electrothrix aestuarii]|uniref:Cytochrome c oxidase subunit 2 n=1 Tax=Candidatus Electrothrix aestuarii TaxID=3062594 RepID=A0AAU8M0X0_9BACT|nr:cytochrome c oxidase subunit II [Candidatus Electrothrix aestuarii]